jgi:PhzF family phenazine biosynthesis protein
MKIPLYQVDAFASRVFTGNPAAICPLVEWLPDEQLQAIALENNVSETAFYIPQNGRYHLRWFTPTIEMDLCGHATLASAAIILEATGGNRVVFDSRSGELTVTRQDDLYTLDFPSRPAKTCTVDENLISGLGVAPKEVLAARDYLCIYDSEGDVRALNPNMTLLGKIDRLSAIVTAPGSNGIDFVSRFFAPARGVPEDPVTGSSHCTLIPYWSKRLGKTKLHAHQVSPRGGELWLEDCGDRVRISGRVVRYLEGTITI